MRMGCGVCFVGLVLVLLALLGLRSEGGVSRDVGGSIRGFWIFIGRGRYSRCSGRWGFFVGM